jgi:hypothetical protein
MVAGFGTNQLSAKTSQVAWNTDFVIEAATNISVYAVI